MARVYVVEDNDLIRNAVADYFTLHDHEVLQFEKAAGVLDSLEIAHPDAIILDIMLPDGNGYRIAKEVRTKSSVPIIFLTAKESESDRVMGFEIGGDDYVVKPFSTKELYLRTVAVMKRDQRESDVLESGGSWTLGPDTLELDTARRRTTVNHADLELTNAEWTILLYLAQREDRAVSREQILGDCLGYRAGGSERTVDTHIASIRAHLGRPDWIETVRGYGYRFSSDSTS
ncbi:MAG: response regulator transcription factor [Alkalispirochaeta sp.]